MAIIEVQMRREAFVSFLMNQINRQRLPSRTIDAFPDLKGKLLQRIECTGAEVEPSAGADRVVVQADFAFHHNTLAAVRAAGSLQAPPPEIVTMRLPVTFAVVADAQGVRSVQWSILSGLVPGRAIPLDLGDDLTVASGAVVADERIVAIRMGTRPDDPVAGPIVDRLGAHDWAQFVAGQALADVFVEHFSEAIQDALSDELTEDTPASGAWFAESELFPNMVGVSATVVAVDQCIFDIDIPVDLQLIATFKPVGKSLLTTVRLSWEPDSTLCEIVGGLLMTPIASAVINSIATDKAAEKMFGAAKPFEGFVETGRTDKSITYQRTAVVETPSPRFVLDHTAITPEGIVTAGALSLQSSMRALEGEVTHPESVLDRDCRRRTVTVKFQHAQASFRDLGVEGGPPRLLPGGVLFDPADCWSLAPGPSNTWLDLALTFLDPPSGRLPAGTPTSVFLHTDCGLRWLDLGVIPADRPAPTTGDIAQMLSQCMAISDRWGMGVMNLDWLIDPPDLSRAINPVRQWTVAARDLPVGTPMEFYAIDRAGNERRIGVIDATRNFAADFITERHETLQIRTPRGFEAAAPAVWQRWIAPFAASSLEGDRATVVSVGRTIAVRDGRTTRVVELRGDGRIDATPVDESRGRLAHVVRALDRADRRAGAGAVVARVDRETVAFTHRGSLMVGKALPAVRM